MAFIKFKELTHYFNFFKAVDTDNIPMYIKDYIRENETILAVYKTYRDHGVFTDRKIILFDQRGIGNIKEITSISYKSISAISIKFKKTTVDMFLKLNSGYPVRLRFVKLSPDEKRKLRILYNHIDENL